MNQRTTVLLVARDDALVRQVTTVLGEAQLDVVSMADLEGIAAVCANRALELALVDADLGAEAAIRVTGDLKRRFGVGGISILALVSEMDDSNLTALLDAGADDVVGRRIKALSFRARVMAHLSRTWAWQHLARKVHDSEVLIDITSRLVGSADILENLFAVAKVIAAELRVDRCSVVLVRPQRDYGLVVASSDDPDLRSLAINLKRYPEISLAVERGEPLVIDDVASSALLSDVLPSLRDARVASVALFPIARQADTLGVIFLRFFERREMFEEREIVFCQTVANAASIALRNAEILEMLKAKTREVEKVQSETQGRMRDLKRFEDFFIDAVEGRVVLDQIGRIVFVNPRAAEMLGHEPRDLEGRSFADFFALSDRLEFEKLLDAFVRGEARYDVDFRIGEGESEGQGGERVLSISAGSLFDSEGLMQLTTRDVTEERAMERRLGEAQRRLVQSEKRAAMAELAGAAAHELNQPLTSVMTSLAMLRRLLKEAPAAERALGTMEQEAERMATIIRRLTRITTYTTTDYVGEAKIIDLATACSDEPDEGGNG